MSTYQYQFFTIEITASGRASVYPWYDEETALHCYSEQASNKDYYYTYCADNDLEEFTPESIWAWAGHDMRVFVRCDLSELREYLGRYGVGIDVDIKAILAEDEETD